MVPVRDRIERYYDTMPRSFARPEAIGPFTLFVAARGFPYYARPTLGGTGSFTAADLAAVLGRQGELGLPRSFEWVHETTPALSAVARAAGLVVHEHPLMVLGTPAWPEWPRGIQVRMVRRGDRALPALRAALATGFASPGTAVSAIGHAERDAAIDRRDPLIAFTRSRIRRHLLAMAVAEDDGRPVGGGSHAPRHRVTELTGIATLPAYRRRGIGAMVTAHLVADALEGGVELCFLSADSDDVARIYEKVGFARIGTACVAEPPG
jgi:ribosomal protein S18 acetylase RimI-like enzyme